MFGFGDSQKEKEAQFLEDCNRNVERMNLILTGSSDGKSPGSVRLSFKPLGRSIGAKEGWVLEQLGNDIERTTKYSKPTGFGWGTNHMA